MRIRKLRNWKEADADWLKELDSECFLKTDEPLLNGPKYHWWVLEGDKQIIGYAGLYEEGDCVRFCRAGIRARYRGLRLQRLLIKARLAWARKRGFRRARTYTDHINTASTTNLIHCGFECRRLKAYNTFTIELCK